VTRDIPFVLSPGAEIRERLTVGYRREAPLFWLESTGEGDAVIGARKLSLRDACWKAPQAVEVEDPAAIAGVMAAHPGHAIVAGDRLLAEIKLAATDRCLLFYGLFHEKSLRPNLEAPWFGTGIELITVRPPPPGSPSNAQPRKDQVFLVPSADGASAAGLCLKEGGQGVTEAPDIRTWARPLADGCLVAARIPWARLGEAGRPDSLPFEMIVDVVNPQDGAIVQVQAFDLPWDGWQRLSGKLVCETT
jgi:hypothetical protein